MPLNGADLDALQELFLTLDSAVSTSITDEEADAKSLFREGMAIPGGGVEPMNDPDVFKISQQKVGTIEPSYATLYGLDASTARPESFRNGLVVDVANAKAAHLGGEGSEVEHLSTMVAAAFTKNKNTVLEGGQIRDGDIQSELLVVKNKGRRIDISDWVSSLARSTAEGKHAKRISKIIDGPLILDGPLYPLGLLNHIIFARKREKENPKTGLPDVAGMKAAENAVQNYVDTVDTLIERGFPVVGVTKSVGTNMLVKALEKKFDGQQEDGEDPENIPWPSDSQFVSDLLYTTGHDTITFTTWLVETSHKSEQVDILEGFEFDGDRTERDYRRAFFFIRVPSTQYVFRVETPLVMVKDDENAKAIQQMMLREIGLATDTPAVVKRADTLANISQDNSKHLKSFLNNGNMVRDYNKHGRFEDIYYNK